MFAESFIHIRHAAAAQRMCEIIGCFRVFVACVNDPDLVPLAIRDGRDGPTSVVSCFVVLAHLVHHSNIIFWHTPMRQCHTVREGRAHSPTRPVSSLSSSAACQWHFMPSKVDQRRLRIMINVQRAECANMRDLLWRRCRLLTNPNQRSAFTLSLTRVQRKQQIVTS